SGVALLVLSVLQKVPVGLGATRYVSSQLLGEHTRRATLRAQPQCSEPDVTKSPRSRREAVEQYVHHRHHHQRQRGGRDHSAKYGGRQRRPQVRSLAKLESSGCQRRGDRKTGHQDGAQSSGSGLEKGGASLQASSTVVIG